MHSIRLLDTIEPTGHIKVEIQHSAHILYNIQQNSPNKELYLSHNTMIPESYQHTLKAITERQVTLEQSYKDIQEQLVKPQQSLED